LLLKDDLPGLKKYLAEINIPTSPTDFQSTTFHHLELMFYYEDKKQKTYRTVLENWLAHLPLK